MDGNKYLNNPDYMEQFIHAQAELKEQKLAKIIQENDFIVGSRELKAKLASILPEGANIVYSPHIEDSSKVYVVKKYNITDLCTLDFHIPEGSKP